MCSHRETTINRRFHAGVRAAARSGGAAVIMSVGRLVISERGARDFMLAGEACFKRLPVKIDVLLEQVVTAVLARDFEIDGVLAGLDEFAGIILAVPGEAVL